MRVLGMISGTSHDGIDAAVVDFDLAAAELGGDELSGTVVHHSTTPYPADLRARLRAALPPAKITLAETCQLDTLIGQSFAEVAARVAAEVGGVDAICSHGQTVYHWVRDDQCLGTLQIGQPAWIAERVGVPVISDVRIRDITAGGHGAPLVSILDEYLLRGRPQPAAALNLGGISNMTVVADGGVRAHDIGPANALIDAVVVDRGLNDVGYDDGGQIAARGSVDEQLLRVLLADPYYRLRTPKSTGKEHFHGDYLADILDQLGREVESSDLLRTLAELTVRTVAADVRAAGVDLLAVSGGGWHNQVIMDGLRAALPAVEVVGTDDLGAPTDAKEAVAFALIGWCTLHGLPGTVAGGTGASAPRVLGTITPGADALVLPTPLSAPPRGLRLVAR